MGYPLGAFWAQRVQRNADGTIVKVAGRPVLDTASVYMGHRCRRARCRSRRRCDCSRRLRVRHALRLQGRPLPVQREGLAPRPRRSCLGRRSIHRRIPTKCWCASSRRRPTCTFSRPTSSSCATCRSATTCRSRAPKRYVERATVTRRGPQPQDLDEIRRRRSRGELQRRLDVQPQ